VLSKQLRNLGCTVYVANHGGECIELLQRTRFWRGREPDGLELSVILMDLEMPVMDGLTCTRKIRDYQRDGAVVGHIPIIAV
jgi:CheY-like chemotaxis protein